MRDWRCGWWENLLYPAIVEDANVLSDSQQGPGFRLDSYSPVGASRRASNVVPIITLCLFWSDDAQFLLLWHCFPVHGDHLHNRCCLRKVDLKRHQGLWREDPTK
jgi:hypothetical protein